MSRKTERLTEAVILAKPALNPVVVAGRVLLASEDESRRRGLAQALARDGHHVVECRAPLELLKQVRHPSPGGDVLVLDLTGRDWCIPELIDVLAAEPGVPRVIAVAEEPEALEGAPGVTPLSAAADEVMLRAEVMSVLWSPGEQGAA